ncbi:MAG: peptidylprolyl isomerase [Bacilli bacterium]|nr:peptidylprolyl isomerase [Bacilli bacterium]
MKKIFLFLVATLLLVTGCGKEMPEENPIVTMTIKNYGDVVIELYPDKAFNTVANFVNLIEDGFYDNNTMHRLVKGFVLQGGDPTATGTGGPGYTIKGEFPVNGVNNDLSHTKGVISMARADDYNSAGSQFFIVLNDSAKSSLDNMYAGFGEVIEGMDVIESIEQADLEYSDMTNGMLKEPLTIEKVTVDTKGYKYEVKKYKS